MLVQGSPQYPSNTSFIHELLDKYEGILLTHRSQYLELYKLIEEQKILRLKEKEAQVLTPVIVKSQKINEREESKKSIYFKQSKQEKLKVKIAKSYKEIRQNVIASGLMIIPRTQASNIKQPHVSIEEVKADRSEKLEAQIQAWRSLLPILIRRFSKISDPRRAKSVKHKLVVIMLYGLFAFIFQLSSRRAIN